MAKKWKGKKVLLMGLGVHQGGISLANWLIQRQAVLTITDIKTFAELRRNLLLSHPSFASRLNHLRGRKSVRFVMGRHDTKDFLKADTIVQNPAVPNSSKYLLAAKKNDIPITNEAAIFLQETKATVVAITGTRGKSTVSYLIYQLLTALRGHKVYLAGNIASCGLASVIDRASRKDFVVAELSSFQLEHLKRQIPGPHVAVVTNIYPDHLDRYKDYASYQSAKMNLLKRQKPHDITILNHDNTVTRDWQKLSRGKVFFFSSQQRVRGCFTRNGLIIYYNGARFEPIVKIRDVGRQFIPLENVLAAVTVAKALGLSNSKIRQGLEHLKALPFRLQTVGSYNGVRIINDSCSTAPSAAQNALRLISGNIVMIAGGVDKHLPYAELAETISLRVRHLVLLPGTASDKIERELHRTRYTSFTKARGLRQAINLALRSSSDADYILFSPAASSFNLFANEFDRGRQFNEMIRHALKKTN